MRLYGWLTLFILLLLTLFTIDYRDSETGSIQELHSNLLVLDNTTMFLTEELFPYESSFQQNFTFEGFVTNTVHILVYPLIREISNIVGAWVNWVWKNVTFKRMNNIIRISFVCFSIWLVGRCISPIAIIYVLMNEWLEKKGRKVNPFIVMGLSFLLFCLIVAIAIISLIIIGTIM